MPFPENRPYFVSRSDWDVVSSPWAGTPRGKLSATHEAIVRLLEFMAENKPGVFPHFTREHVAAGLYERVKDASKIHQRNATLCGPAQILHNRARQKPVEYVRFVTELYTKGVSNFGRLKVKASKGVRNHDPSKHPDGNGNSIHPADWIPLASLRDSENLIMRYDSVKDGMAGGTPVGELKEWLSKVGYNRVLSSTDYFFHRDEANAQRASHLYNNNYRVFLLIDSQILNSQFPNGVRRPGFKPQASKSGNHWVALRSSINMQQTRISARRSKSSISLDVFSWGHIYRIPGTRRKMPIGFFMLHYFGYVAAAYTAS